MRKQLKFILWAVLVGGACYFLIPKIPELNTSATISVLLGFIVWLSQLYITTKGEISPSQNEISSLKKENSALDKELSQLKEEHEKLNTKISNYSNHKNLLDNYEPDTLRGFLVNKDDKNPYCIKCIHEKEKEIALTKSSDSTWECTLCGKYYYEPQGNLPRHADGDTSYGSDYDV